MHENKAMKLLASPQWQHTLTHDKPMAATLGLGRLTLSKPSPTPPCLPLKPSKNKKTCFSRQFSHICCSVLDANNEGSSPKPNTQASLTSTAVSPPPSVSLSMPGVEEGWEVARLSEEADPESIREWELDFCSRPIFDIRGKKLWELVVCDSQRNLEFSKFFPNNVINSITLKDSLVSICDSLGVPKPTIARFFRSQMQTIVSKACNELGIRPVPSKRCFALTNWLEERYESVYKRHPGFKEGINPLPAIDKPFPLPLPDSLQGEKWAFVQLPLEAVREEIVNIKKQSMYGNFLDLDMLKTELPEDTMIPGVAVASSRATALAAWTDSLEIASIDVDRERGCLTLTAGVSKRWLYAYYRKSAQTDKEAEAWEECKKECGGLHFLAVQDSLESESCTGFWLILDFPNPPI